MDRPVGLVDGHCHAWSAWPYEPPVPDPESRGRVEQLLYEMDRNGVDQALVVCAQIAHNTENNAYIADRVAAYPDRLHQLADLDSVWSATYRSPGADTRLRQMAERWPIKGFAHYLSRDDDGGWLSSADGRALLTTAAELGLIASLSCYPHQQATIRAVAAHFPTLPILLHHLGHPRAGEPPPYAELQEILMSAHSPNVYVKVSGFTYATSGEGEYPFVAAQPIVRALYETYGAGRLCWGSDYPVVRPYMTYRQALDAFRVHCDFVSPEDQAMILGGTLQGLLQCGGSPTRRMMAR
jgi:L-fuconolactonase